jgi:hypothetical protein
MSLTLDNGRIVKLMVTEFIVGVTEIDMRESGKLVLDMEMELISLQMVISM